MKRVLVSILLLVYFTVSSGFVVNLHYCMGDFAGVDIGHSDDHDCGTCGMPVKEKGGCCHDDVKVIKVVQDQSAATFAVFSFGIAKSLPVTSYFFLKAPVSIAHLYAAPAHAPPLFSEQDLYLQYRVFRI